jgi:hypothetical protein
MTDFESIGGDLEARTEGRYIVIRAKGGKELCFMSRNVVLKMLKLLPDEDVVHGAQAKSLRDPD